MSEKLSDEQLLSHAAWQCASGDAITLMAEELIEVRQQLAQWEERHTTYRNQCKALIETMHGDLKRLDNLLRWIEALAWHQMTAEEIFNSGLLYNAELLINDFFKLRQLLTAGGYGPKESHEAK